MTNPREYQATTTVGGTVQLGASYSFTYRTAWAGRDGIRPSGNDNIFMSSFRYYLP